MKNILFKACSLDYDVSGRNSLRIRLFDRRQRLISLVRDRENPSKLFLRLCPLATQYPRKETIPRVRVITSEIKDNYSR